ncbi:MAG: DUF488 family protein, N3 subclade [Bythopirellula sp.]
MLARYKIYRGKPPAGVRLPDGIRQDTRKHTRHCLRPAADDVAEYLADLSPRGWKKFSTSYLKTVQQRWQKDATPFETLAALATDDDVYLGCSCPTEKNPDVLHCHTVLALQFMEKRFPQLKIEYPQ